VKVKLDENLPTELLDDLRAAGHEADTVHDEALTGAPDSIVLDQVRHDGRVLFTLDKGIANVRAYPPERHAGIVLFRPGSMGRGTTLAFVRHYLPAVLERDLTGRLM
jgi:predicted nuclease of predicted toxin-antitoxin system